MTQNKTTLISLKDFIKTGHFGLVKIGMTKDEVIKVLGQPDSDNDYGTGSGGMMFARYEFFYWQNNLKINGIQNDHLQADCSNHKEMINFKNELWTIDKWFLQDNKNKTFGEVVELLNLEKISFEIVPSYSGSNENVIKCLKSNVTFDFVNEYSQIELNEKGKFKTYKDYIEEEQSNYVLNGIRLFDY
ncbi:hypothetical protein [Fluviicola taffensis]|uniref:Uncharacterized protein n=1 Tax=Fluviicola taffensis (strain DSM 16823 / NCIMB 13979 / RW262) TaxID=755732 RepID=F2ICX8_FLUTR|nr:hypothetical protein [Fluviicola taffensis]AEA43352.1 hypothetical protein Fluta_1357 [Fluviicola taffensis DSM 16823]